MSFPRHYLLFPGRGSFSGVVVVVLAGSGDSGEMESGDE